MSATTLRLTITALNIKVPRNHLKFQRVRYIGGLCDSEVLPAIKLMNYGPRQWAFDLRSISVYGHEYNLVFNLQTWTAPQTGKCLWKCTDGHRNLSKGLLMFSYQLLTSTRLSIVEQSVQDGSFAIITLVSFSRNLFRIYRPMNFSLSILFM